MKKSLTIKLLIIVGIAIALLAISRLLIPNLIPTQSDMLKSVLILAQSILEPTAQIVLITGLCVLAFRDPLSVLWAEAGDSIVQKITEPIEPKLRAANQSLISSLDQIKNDTSAITTSITGFYDRRDKPVTIGECTKREDYIPFLQKISDGLYGIHSKNEGSLFSYTTKTLFEPFCTTPHPSNVQKTISILKTENDDIVQWKDTTKYKIHHVSHYSQNRSNYILKHRFSSYAKNINIDKWTESLKLEIFRGKSTKNLIDHTKIKYEEPKGDDGFYIWKDGDWIFSLFQENLELNDQEWTDIEIRETSLNESADKFLSISTPRPACGYHVDFTLPKGWKFRPQKPQISPKKLIEGFLSERPGQSPPQDPDKILRSTQEDRMIIDIEGWVMPGIITYLGWEIGEP